jgi:CheY-like chemotaxis protein/HPt (histidine-containing phosphotransfer) domain-containing protein
MTEMLLEDDVPVDEAKDCLKKIHMAGGILMELINDILDISKIESGKLELAPTQYELAGLLNDIAALNIFRIKEKPITFKLDIDDTLYNWLYGDDLRVKQVLNNLLSNAFKYTKEGTATLKVGCSRGDEYKVWLNISVSDTGIGIRPEDMEKLFHDYNQVDIQANRLIEGTGLGLSITKGLVELMGGKISVESEYGKGTTFSVSLLQGFVGEELIDEEVLEALRDMRYEEKKQTGSKPERPDLSHVTVLAVDDYPPNLDVARWILGKYKIKVDCLNSGQEAVDRIALGEPVYDAIFMDHMMPGMDGIEAVQHIRAIDSEYARNVPVIALTANAVVGTEKMFLDNGFQAFLSKPINQSKLDAVIKEWIAGESSSEPRLSTCEPQTSTCNSQLSTIEIPGVNAELGMYLFDDDREMFVDFLRSYVEYIPAELDSLRSVSGLTLKDYAINVHTVKGTSAGIGASDVADFARRLEMMAKAGDLDGVLSENESFLKEADKLVADIRDWFTCTA